MRLTGSLIFVILFLLLGAGGYVIYRHHESTVLASAAQDHENLARGFANSTWKAHAYKIVPLMQSGADISEEIDVAVFAADLESYFSGMNVVGVQIFSPQKILVANVGGKGGVSPVSPPAAELDKAIAGKKAYSMPVSSGDHALVETIVPIMKDGAVEMLMVIAADMTSENGAFMLQLILILAGILLLAIGLQVMSTLSIKKAEGLISKQYEENAELQAQADLAREETKQKSQFLANITHELRTPLNAIIGFSDILKNEFVPAPGQSNHTNYINDIHSAGTHLLSLINDILDYSKAEAGKLELEVTEVNIVKMIQNCIRLVQPRAEMGNVRVVDALPKTPVILTTDGKKFKQVLLNLLSNAVKFTPPEGTVKVSVWEDLQTDSWFFEVRDTGIGIAPKDISRAMAPFGQVDSALSRKFEGTGLGLPLVKKFIELMGGTFGITSEIDKGTTVTFSLPKEFRAPEGVIVKQVA